MPSLAHKGSHDFAPPSNCL